MANCEWVDEEQQHCCLLKREALSPPQLSSSDFDDNLREVPS